MVAPRPKVNSQLSPSWDLVNPSVQLVRQNFEPIVFINLLPALVMLLGSVLLRHSQQRGIAIEAVGGLWLLVNAPVTYYLQLAASHGRRPATSECYSRGLPYFWRLLGFEIVFLILLAIGLFLLIVPGLIVLRRYYLTPFYIIDQRLGIFAAMRSSHADTQPLAGYIWGTIGVGIAIAILAAFVSSLTVIGAIASAFVGLIYLFGPALRYREVIAAAGSLGKMSLK